MIAAVSPLGLPQFGGVITGSGTLAEVSLTESWDFSRPDEQPGLGAQVWRWMRNKQLTELTPRMQEEVAERNARRAKGLPAARDDDDD